MQNNTPLNIVFWAFPSWNGDYMKSTVELAKELAVHHNVMYIDYAYTVKDVLMSNKKSFTPVKRILGVDDSLQYVQLESEAVIRILSLPPIVPFNWTSNTFVYQKIQALNFKLIAPRIKKSLASLDFVPDVVINAFNPFFGDATLRMFPEAAIVYYCYDNIDAARWASVHGGRLEKVFMEKADAIVFSSDALLKCKSIGRDAYVVNNGVDLRNFESQGRTKRMAHVSAQKVVGYVGSLDNRVDYQLLEKVIQENPNFEFQFIGRIMVDEAKQLTRFPNVKLTGAIDTTLLPSFIETFDVGIIPFLKNEFTSNIYPMKVNEYLAVGIPVVATDFANLNDLQGFLSVANSATVFSALLRLEIENDNIEAIEKRKVKAKSNSWAKKANEFENIMLKYVR
jgi:glycosyltransferase involved in cell wall biosynthesis